MPESQTLPTPNPRRSANNTPVLIGGGACPRGRKRSAPEPSSGPPAAESPTRHQHPHDLQPQQLPSGFHKAAGLNRQSHHTRGLKASLASRASLPASAIHHRTHSVRVHGHLLRGNGGMHQDHQAALPQLTSDRQPLNCPIGQGFGEQQGVAGAGGGPLGQAARLPSAAGALHHRPQRIGVAGYLLGGDGGMHQENQTTGRTQLTGHRQPLGGGEACFLGSALQADLAHPEGGGHINRFTALRDPKKQRQYLDCHAGCGQSKRQMDVVQRSPTPGELGRRAPLLQSDRNGDGCHE
jgi:hypothetical protein